MSVEQTNVIDFIGVSRETGEVVLTISDHLTWTDSVVHQTILQNKLNAYLSFIESGDLFQEYPDARGRAVVVRIVFRNLPDGAGREFLARAKQVMESAGLALREEVYTGARFN